MHIRSVIASFPAAVLLLWTAGGAVAQSPTAPPMTCDQAVALYERNGVIHVRANGRTTVPLRVGTPVRRAGGLQCNGRGQVPHGYAVRTSDVTRCVIAIRC